MVFDESDTGPFYASQGKSEKRKLDGNTGKLQEWPILKDRMIEMLKECSIIDP
jgi:hypothetical protein